MKASMFGSAMALLMLVPAWATATPDAARFSDAILLIIDAQREYVDGGLPLADIHEA